MPRLSDLLPEQLKKQLAAETRKAGAVPPAEKGGREPGEKHPAPPAIPLPDFIAVDVETTGLEFSSDRVIEIGAVKFSGGRPGGEFSSFVNPGVPVPQVITDLTGITDADVTAAPRFADIAEKFLAFIGELPLCGHQITFDLTFLNKELERCGRQPIGKQSLDTALLSRIIFQAGTRFSLKSVSDKLDVSLTNAHRALADAKASGEVAALLVPKIAQLPLHVRQTMAAAAPASFLKTIIYQSLGGGRPGVSVRAHPENVSPARLSAPETFRSVGVETIKTIFSNAGALAHEMPSFSLRDSQRAMAMEVAEAFNTQSILLAEAGTGTGKSLAYLVPAALWAVANKTTVAVATRTRNLQDQLMAKELPLVAKVAGGAFRFSVLKGRGNYLCINKWERLLRGEAGNLSVRERFAVLPLVPWVESTATGDIEEQNQFNPKWFHKVWDLISAESHGCEGRRCPRFSSCFLQRARGAAQSAHVLVINHALFFSEIGRADSFLSKVTSLVFDEAHHLESGGHKHLRVELDTNRTALFLEQLNNLSGRLADIRETDPLAAHARELKSLVKRVRKHANAFLDAVIAWTAARRQGNGAATGEYQVPLKSGDLAQNIEAPALANTLDALKDRLYQLKQDLVAAALPPKLLDVLKEEVPFCQEQASQYAADLVYCTAAQTEDHAFWVEGNAEKGWVKLCGVPLDVAGLLSSLWAERTGAIVFTSATLSVARSADYFFTSVGLEPHKARTAIRFFPSPFTKEQSFVGAMKNAPEPDTLEFPAYVATVIAELHVAFRKNILVLFTANAMLQEVYKRLRADGRIGRQNVLAQNISGGRHALLEQFKQNGQMVLLGTDSFWEGIDVPGETCEIVVMPRLPFPVPTHPLTMAIAEKMALKHGESFMSYAVPEAVIRFRQGCGRLIRTAQDRGALVIIDNRIINRGYGKQFVRSLETDVNTFDDTAAMLGRIKSFFDGAADTPAPSGISYVPFDEV